MMQWNAPNNGPPKVAFACLGGAERRAKRTRAGWAQAVDSEIRRLPTQPDKSAVWGEEADLLTIMARRNTYAGLTLLRE